MQSAGKSSTQKSLWLVLAVLAAIVLSAFIIVPFFKDDTTNKKDDDVFLSLIGQSSVLQDEFQKLQALNEKYAATLSDSDMNAEKLQLLDSLNNLINTQQSGFAHLLDSVQSNASSYNKNSFDLFNRIIQSYRSAFRQSNALNVIRNTLSISNLNFNDDSSALLDMQMKLQNRELENLTLSQQLTESKNTEVLNSPDNFKKFLSQKDTMLNNMLETQQKRNENLVGYNLKLEKENQSLKNQLAALQNVPQPTNTTAVNTVSAARLNADLNLTKVDCYLLRADARQIISNSKQRRDLLENALTLLNSLSQSDDAYVQQQVKDKMSQLKRIAADNHD